MRRGAVAALLSLLVGVLGAAAPAHAAKNIAFGGFYRGLSPTLQKVFLCEASAQGGVVVFTRITKCTMTGSFGGFARGVTPITYPGPEAITAGVGAFPFGTYTVCFTATARFADGTFLTESACELAHHLPR